MSRNPLALALLIAAVAGPGAAARDRGVPEATPDGKPVDCITLRQIRQSPVRSDQVIDFVGSGGRVYRNILPQSCPSLGFEKRFSLRTSISQLCSTDVITVLRTGPGIQSGPSCGLGKFQPVKIVKTAR